MFTISASLYELVCNVNIKNQQKKPNTQFFSSNFMITNAFLNDGNVENNQRNKLFSLISFHLEIATTTSVVEKSIETTSTRTTGF